MLTYIFIGLLVAGALFDFFDRDENNIGYIPLWLLVIILGVALADRYDHWMNSILFTAYFAILAFVGSKAYKKPFFDIFGEGDYFIFISAGLYIDNLTEFVLFFITLGIAYLIMSFVKKDDKDHEYIPMLPLLLAGTIAVTLDNTNIIERLNIL